MTFAVDEHAASKHAQNHTILRIKRPKIQKKSKKCFEAACSSTAKVISQEVIATIVKYEAIAPTERITSNAENCSCRFFWILD